MGNISGWNIGRTAAGGTDVWRHVAAVTSHVVMTSSPPVFDALM